MKIFNTSVLGLLIVLLSACDYVRLLRPSVLEQVEPPVARLVNHLPRVDSPNEAIIARLYAGGGLTHVVTDADGVMHDEIWARPGQLIWTPSLIVMPRGGELELVFHNPDELTHIALMPSNGGLRMLELPPRSSGRITLDLNAPGFYWFGCPVANHVGRNMFGFILVEGDVPQEARLDRPPQPQPGPD